MCCSDVHKKWRWSSATRHIRISQLSWSCRKKHPPMRAHTNLKFRSFYSNIEAGILNYYAPFLPGSDFLEFSVIKQPAQSPSPAAGGRSWESRLRPPAEATPRAGRQVGSEVARRGGRRDSLRQGRKLLEPEQGAGVRAPGCQPALRAVRSGLNPTG